jgi:hypothetical protein
MTMNYSNMKDWELLAERSHMEQLGFNGEVQILEIDEELQRRRSEKAQEPATMVRELIKVKILSEGKHSKNKRYVGPMGHYQYTAEETELNEVFVSFQTHYPGSMAKMVFDDDFNLQKIAVTGAGAKTFNKAIKKTAEKWFDQEYRG